jgi:uncharacterized protein DUF6298
MGPLKVDPANPRYFSDGCGRAVYLTGSHAHLSFKDGGDRPQGVSPLDYDAYIRLMAFNNHNLMRMWSGWELTLFNPQPWERTGPGLALDGGPKFDLTKLDASYFERLRQRVLAAQKKGIYVSVMIFEGWLLRFVPDSARQHPFHAANNINGIAADPDRNGKMIEAHTLANPAVTAIQEAYIRKIVDTLNDLDNVLYEIANESVFPGSVSWQYHMIHYLKQYQATKPQQHPVGITSAGFSASYDDLGDLLESPADWISPGRPVSLAYDYLNNPPAADGLKVIISDNDHLGLVLDNPAWIWKSLTRGINPIFMDVYPPLDSLEQADASFIRKTLGFARRYAEKTDLSGMSPRGDLSSTRYALANPGSEYLIYQPGSGGFTVSVKRGRYDYEWFDPSKGSVAATGSLNATASKTRFSPPFAGSAVLYIKRAESDSLISLDAKGLAPVRALRSLRLNSSPFRSRLFPKTSRQRRHRSKSASPGRMACALHSVPLCLQTCGACANLPSAKISSTTNVY